MKTAAAADGEQSVNEWPKLRRLLLAILLNGPMLVAAIESSVMIPFFPLEATAKGLSPSQVGVVSAVLDVTYCLTSLAAVRLILRMGLRVCLSLGCLALAAAAAAFAAVTIISDAFVFFSVCLILRSLAGAAGAVADTASCTYMMDRAKDDLPFMVVSEARCSVVHAASHSALDSPSWSPRTSLGC